MQSGSSHYNKEILSALINPSIQNKGFNTFDFLGEIQKNLITMNQRETLIYTIVNLCHHLNVSTKVEQLAIYYLDSFLSKRKINLRERLDLLSITVVSMALKYEESRLIHNDTITALSQGTFNNKLIQYTEVLILQDLDWKIEKTTPHEILRFLISYTCQDFNSERFFKEADNYTRISLADYRISMNSPLILAISSALCIFIKRGFNEFHNNWLAVLEKLIGTDLSVCNRVANEILMKLGGLTH